MVSSEPDPTAILDSAEAFIRSADCQSAWEHVKRPPSSSALKLGQSSGSKSVKSSPRPPSSPTELRPAPGRVASPFLLVRRVAVLAQNALHQHAQVRPHVLAQRPVDGDVVAHRRRPAPGRWSAESSSPSTFTALSLVSSAS